MPSHSGFMMANLVLRPTNSNSSNFLTFIIPAADGCNLSCSYCIIAQRQEITRKTLNPKDYVAFIEGAAAHTHISAIAIQGYEPLLPSSLPYSAAILSAGQDLGIPCTLVTNGVHLMSALEPLTKFNPNRIGVSLDATAPERHDKLRGTAGAWAQTTKGIAAAASRFANSGTQLTVISTAMPGHAAYLLEMPALLRNLGVRDWIVNPLMSIGAGKPGEFNGHANRILKDLALFQEAADREGVDLTIDDEFDLLRPCLTEAQLTQYSALNVRKLPPGATISRLLPSGHCSAGKELLSTLSDYAPRWRPENEAPAQFYRRVTRTAPHLAHAA